MLTYEKYKDSKVAWLGQIPEHWDDLRLAGCFTEVKETNKDSEFDRAFQFKYGNIVYKKNAPIDAEAIATFKKYAKVNENDIVVNGLNLNYDFLTQRVAIVHQRGIITSAYITMTPRDIIVPKFACYLLKGIDEKKLLNGMGTGIRLTLSFGELKKQYIPYPSVVEQEQIVRYLDWKVAMADKFVREKRREITLLKELRQAEINRAVTHGLDPTASTRPSGIDWIGEIPQHWKEVLWGQCFSEIIEKNKDGSFSKASSFRYGEIEQKNEIGTDEELNNTYNNYTILKVGDIVINGLNLNYDFITQRVAIANYNTIITSAYISIRCKKSVVPQYACYLLKSFDNKKVFNGMGKGIRLTLSFTELKKQYLFIPPIEEQQQIVEHIKIIEANINKAIEKIENEIALTAEYKTRLISDVTTGKVDVRGIEIPDFTIEEEPAISDNEEIDE